MVMTHGVSGAFLAEGHLNRRRSRAMLRQISLLPARASCRSETTRLGAVLQHRLHHLVHLHVLGHATSKRCHGKAPLRDGFWSQTTCPSLRNDTQVAGETGSIGSIEIAAHLQLLSRAGHELGRRLTRAVRHQVVRASSSRAQSPTTSSRTTTCC